MAPAPSSRCRAAVCPLRAREPRQSLSRSPTVLGAAATARQLGEWASPRCPPPLPLLAPVNRTHRSTKTTIWPSATKNFRRRGGSLQKPALPLLLPVPHACRVSTEAGLTHRSVLRWASSRRLHHGQGGSTGVSCRRSETGLSHAELPVMGAKRRGSWQGGQSHLFPPVLPPTFPKGSRVACVRCSLLALSHCLLSKSQAASISPLDNLAGVSLC